MGRDRYGRVLVAGAGLVLGGGLRGLQSLPHQEQVRAAQVRGKKREIREETLESYEGEERQLSEDGTGDILACNSTGWGRGTAHMDLEKRNAYGQLDLERSLRV